MIFQASLVLVALAGLPVLGDSSQSSASVISPSPPPRPIPQVITAAGAIPPSPDAPAIVVTLIGTASNPPSVQRAGPGTLVQLFLPSSSPQNSTLLLFDAGRTVTTRLRQVGVSSGAINAVLLTHLHSDHVDGLPDLWATGFLRQPSVGARPPGGLRIAGPRGTRGYAEAMRIMGDVDVRARVESENVELAAADVVAWEVPLEGGVVGRSGPSQIAAEVAAEEETEVGSEGNGGVEVLEEGEAEVDAADTEPDVIADEEVVAESGGSENVQSLPSMPMFAQDGIVVKAFPVNHSAATSSLLSYGYRVDFQGMSVVLSGDTVFSPELTVPHAGNADLFVHEVCAVLPPTMLPDGTLQSVFDAFPGNRLILGKHITPEDAGKIFAATRPKMVAYTHILQLTPKGPVNEGVDDALIVQETRKNWDGKVVVGKDLTRFLIQPGKDVVVQEWDNLAQRYNEPISVA